MSIRPLGTGRAGSAPVGLELPRVRSAGSGSRMRSFFSQLRGRSILLYGALAAATAAAAVFGANSVYGFFSSPASASA